MQDRSIRSLARLQNSGATSRVLNLIRVERLHGDSEEHRTRPMFKNRLLNRAIYVKHRLRDNERELFADYRPTATKIILPMDRGDLKAGGRWAFVGERGYDSILAQLIGEVGVDGAVDKKTLEALDQIPSFDPFLLREHLRRSGLQPAACYFEISEGDLKKMFAFLQHELKDLVRLAGGAESQFAASTAVLVQKILSSAATEDMEPLRLTLRLAPEEFVEGLFCWKGFLYYKWRLDEFRRSVPALLDQIARVRPADAADPELKLYLSEARARISEQIKAHSRAVHATLDIYDTAYGELVQRGQPLGFRKFLLDAPALFLSLGEKLGVLDHMISFWAVRFGARKTAWGSGDLPPAAPVVELVDIFVDFENSLGMTAGPQVEWAPQMLLVG